MWQTYDRGQTKFERFTPRVFDRLATHDDARWLTLRTADTRVAFIAIEPLPFLLSGQTGYRAKLELGHTLDAGLATYLAAHPEEDRSRAPLSRER